MHRQRLRGRPDEPFASELVAQALLTRATFVLLILASDGAMGQELDEVSVEGLDGTWVVDWVATFEPVSSDADDSARAIADQQTIRLDFDGERLRYISSFRSDAYTSNEARFGSVRVVRSEELDHFVFVMDATDTCGPNKAVYDVVEYDGERMTVSLAEESQRTPVLARVGLRSSEPLDLRFARVRDP